MNINVNSSHIVSSGFTDPVIDSQSIFRKLLKSMSEPGVLSEVEFFKDRPDTLYDASYAIALSLFDQDTPLLLGNSLHNAANVETLRFHSALNITDILNQADFIVCDENEIPDLSELNVGNEEYPDQSCTLIIQCASFSEGKQYQATGPGIETQRFIHCSGLTPSLHHQRTQLMTQFPLGIDLIFTNENHFFCLPRTTLLTEGTH